MDPAGSGPDNVAGVKTIFYHPFSLAAQRMMERGCSEMGGILNLPSGCVAIENSYVSLPECMVVLVWKVMVF